MPRREAELVITARDNARKALDNVSGALDRFSASQAKAGQAASKTSGLVGELETEIAGLEAKSAQLDSFAKLASQFQQAGAALQALEARVAGSRAEFTQLSVSASQAATAVQEIQNEFRQAEAALAAQKAETDATVQAQRALAAEVGQAAARYRLLIAAYRQGGQASETLRESIRDQQNELIRLTQAQVANRDELAQQRARVASAQQAYNSLSRELKAAERNLVNLNRQFDRSAQTTLEQSRRLDEANAAYAELKSATDVASRALGGLAADEKAIAEASSRAAQEINELNAALQRQRSLGSSGEAAQTVKTLRQQELAVNGARDALLRAQAEVDRLGQAMRAATAPSDSLARSFLIAKANADQASAAYKRQQQALAEALQTQRIAGFERAIRSLTGVNVNLAQSFERTRVAATQANQGTAVFGNGIRSLGQISKRVRGELLSLTVQFAGVYAAVIQLQGVVKVFTDLERAAAATLAATGGDAVLAGNSLRFVRGEADRLGVSYVALAQEFGKFAAATRQSNISTEATREIFSSVAETARVLGLTVEQTQGTYNAFTQIISKGTFSLEELRQQLGDRLPGALGVFAESMGVSTAEVIRLISAGELAANEENLLKFARALREEFSGGLPTAIESLNAGLGRFGNALTRAQATVAQGGFADALGRALDDLVEKFNSEEGQEFFLKLGAALGTFVDILIAATDFIDEFALALQLFVSIKAAQFVLSLTASFSALIARLVLAQQATAAGIATDTQAAAARGVLSAATSNLAVATVGLIRSFQAYSAAVVAGASGTAVMQARLAALAASARAAGTALLTVGRALAPLAVVTAATFAIGSLFVGAASDVDEMNQSLFDTNRLLEQFQVESKAAADEAREFNRAAVDASSAEVLAIFNASFVETAQAVVEARSEVDDMSDSLRRLDVSNEEAKNQVAALSREYAAGRLTTFEYRRELNELFESIDDAPLQNYIAQLIRTTQAASEGERATAELAVTADRLGAKTFPNLEDAIKRVGLRFNEATGEVEALNSALSENEVRAQQRADLLRELEEEAPTIRRENERNAQDRRIAQLRELSAGTEDQARAERAINDILADRARQDRRGRRTDAQRLAEEQRRFREELEQTIRDRQFEVSLIGQTARQQEVLQALYEAENEARAVRLELTQQQRDAITESVGATFDAIQAERVRADIEEQTFRLRELRGEAISVQERLEREARRQNIDLLTEEGRLWAEITGQILEREDAGDRLNDQLSNLRDLEQQRIDAQETLNELINNFAGAEAIEAQRQKVEQLTTQLIDASVAAEGLAIQLGDKDAAEEARDARGADDQIIQPALITLDQIVEVLDRDLPNAVFGALDAIAQAIAGTSSWGDAIEGVANAFRQFAADFLRQIAQMIIQALILRAIQSTLGFLGFGGVPVPGQVAHEGGIAGEPARLRAVPASVFRNAHRYHSGGGPGLRSNEVPAILERGEEVLTETDPRHRNNGGGAGKTDVTVVNTIDPGDFVSQGLSTRAGQTAIVNFMQANKRSIKKALS